MPTFRNPPCHCPIASRSVPRCFLSASLRGLERVVVENPVKSAGLGSWLSLIHLYDRFFARFPQRSGKSHLPSEMACCYFATTKKGFSAVKEREEGAFRQKLAVVGFN